MSPASVTYESCGRTAVLTIDHEAKMNAMTYDMWASLPALVARAEFDRDVRVIAVTGAGDRAFCAGADISQFAEKRSGEAAVATYDTVVACGVNALLNASKPTVAIIRGICFGGGFMLALSCDLRFAREDSRFRVPAARLGIGYATADVDMMIKKIGTGPTSDLLLSARILDAAEGLRLGVANRSFPLDAFESEVAAALSTMVGNAPLTLKAVKRTIVELMKPDGQRNLAAAEAIVDACFRSADYREGRAAFEEKRDPVFRGQ